MRALARMRTQEDKTMSRVREILDTIMNLYAGTQA